MFFIAHVTHVDDQFLYDLMAFFIALWMSDGVGVLPSSPYRAR